MSAPDSTPPPPAAALTRPRLLARNAALNLFGLVAPALVAIWAVPLLIAGFGTERFALITLAWLIIGHASVLDLGMGRALTRALADKLGRGDLEGTAPTVWTALLAVGAFGVAAAGALVLAAPWLGRDLLRVPEALTDEAVAGFAWLALGMPAVVLTAALRGVLEAQQRFGIVTALRIPGGILMFVGPLAALLLSARFDVAVIVLVAIRIALTGGYLAACLATLPALRRKAPFVRGELGGLLRFGGWTTAAGAVAMTMDYAARFSIGALLPVAFVAYYATPADILVKLLVLPTAILGVLFPAIAVHYGTNPAEAARLVDRALRLILLLMVPATVVLVALGYEILAWWIDPNFAAEAAGVLRWLAVGALVNGLASVPVGALAGANRPELTAIPPLVQLPLFVAAVWAVLQAGLGIVGVAAVFAVRNALDGVVMAALLHRVLPFGSAEARRIAVLLALTTLVLAAAAWPAGPPVRAALALGLGGLFAVGMWRFGIDAAERQWLRGLLVRPAR